MFGFNPVNDIIGVCVGHLYYYLEDVVPKIPDTRDVRLLKAPQFMVKVCELAGIHGYRANNNDGDFAFEDDQNGGIRVAGDNIIEDVLIDDNNDDANRMIF